ncbi:hypothetical protein ACFLRM_00995 [Acidobacteriota bacterium]
MDRRLFFKCFFSVMGIGTVTAYTYKSYAGSEICPILYRKPRKKKHPNEFLKEIYQEVVDLGDAYNENFIKREFHINLDGNSRNKEEHVVVLIQNADNKEKMHVQVTYFEHRKGSNIIKYARDIKEIFCSLSGETMEMNGCDYEEKEIRPLLRKILQGIRDKKKFLKLLGR